MNLELFNIFIELLKKRIKRQKLTYTVLEISTKADVLVMRMLVNDIEYKFWIKPEFPNWVYTRLPVVCRASAYVRYTNILTMCRNVIRDSRLQKEGMKT